MSIKPSKDRKPQGDSFGKAKKPHEAVAKRKAGRSSLQRSFDLLWLSHEIPVARSLDDLAIRYNRRIVTARYELLVAEGMDEEKARAAAQRQAVSRSQLERDISAIQRAAEDSATAHAREGWLATAIEATEENRQVLRAIRARALEAHDRSPDNPHFLAIVAATVPAESKLLGELLQYHGMRQVEQLPVVVGTAEQLAASGEDVGLLLDVVRRDPRQSALVVAALGRLMVAARRAKVVEEGGKKPERKLTAGGALPVLFGVKVIGGEAEGGN
jgi:hypothetical protein